MEFQADGSPRTDIPVGPHLKCEFDRAALGAALFFVMLCCMLASGTADAEMRREPLMLVTAGGAQTFEVEIASTAEEKAMGLMFRTSLADHAGMLFPYSPPQEATMWMRNTYISLDMIFIRADGVIHRIESRTEPFSERVIASHGDVAAVLELKAGTAERLGLKPGDQVQHGLFAGGKVR